MDLLQIKNLNFQYPTSDTPSLNNISFEVKSGDFVVICGETGCGKTTLLRMLKPELSPHGKRSGEILYCGRPLLEPETAEEACEIGYVMQRPENQIVTDKVWHELAFGLENIGMTPSIIRRRVSEMASYFGIGDWFEKNTAELSGGQKQLLNLAAVMVMQPKLLILDEPTAQLDPIAAGDFIATLQKLNREFGLTILLVEHRMEEVFPIADKVMVMGQGKILCYDSPREVGRFMRTNERLALSMPCAMRIYSAFDYDVECPITVKEGRTFIEEHFDNKVLSLGEKNRNSDYIGKPALEFSDVCFRHEKESADVLRHTEFFVRENEAFCMLGSNASGKTTSLLVAAGLLKPYCGKVKVFGKKVSDYKAGSLYYNNLAMLPQDVQTVFLKNTVREELETKAGQLEGLNETVRSLISDLSYLNEKHPYDLSGGQQQLCALAKVLLLEPKLLLLDEPTKGIDAYYKCRIVDIIKKLKKDGMTIVIVTHDVEFAALCADRCAMFFCGEITSVDTPEEFFEGNNFYTTAANRMTRNRYHNIITAEDAITICRLNGK